eukprot:TsM_000337800 transcript=TsM_000337800 gene=TsM_000337800
MVALPGWRPILLRQPFSTRLCQHINRFTWVDKHLCQLLFPQPSPNCYLNAPEAILYLREQTKSYSRFLATCACVRSPAIVNFRIMPDLDEDAILESATMTHSKSLLNRFIKNSFMTNLPIRVHWAFVNGYVAVYESAHESPKYYVENSENRLARCDCVIYVVDDSSFSMSDLTATLESLAPHQKLIIAVVINSSLDESSTMECLAKFLQSIGGFKSSPLHAAPSDWRLFCIKRNGWRFVGNFSSLVKWGCYDVLAK